MSGILSERGKVATLSVREAQHAGDSRSQVNMLIAAFKQRN